MAQPSTSHRVAASARSIRLVQRTALAERVRRVLARSRRIQEPSPTTSEEQNDSDNVGGEGSGSEREEEESSSSSEEEEEEEENQFRHDDERVLGDVYDLPCDDAPLPVVQRRRKKKQKKGGKMGSKTRKKKTGGTARSGRVKRRASKSRSRTKHSSQAKSEEGPMDSFVFRRGKTHDPIARLSLLGAGLEPVADDDAPVTENSRRFDQPISRRRGEATSASGTTAAAREEKKSDIDSCDLLGSIIPEQMKTLAPGRLFAVRGGRFNTTEDFEKYKAKKTGQLSSELKERLGIPIDPVQEEAKKTGKAKENVKANVSAKKPLLESCGLGPSNSFKKPGAAAPDSIIRPREEVLESSGDRNSTSSVRKLERPQDSERCDRAEQRKVSSATHEEHGSFKKPEIDGSLDCQRRLEPPLTGNGSGHSSDCFKKPDIPNNRKSKDRLSNGQNTHPERRHIDKGVERQSQFDQRVDRDRKRDPDRRQAPPKTMQSSELHRDHKERGSAEKKSSDGPHRSSDRKHHSRHSSHSHHNGESARIGRSSEISRHVRTAPEGGASIAKPPLKVDADQGTRNVMDNSWMPNLQSSSATTAPVQSSCSPNDTDAGELKKEVQRATDNELLHTIEGIAKEGIKPFVKKISRDQYKGVMRAVVRECYKRRILEKNVIEEKVKKYVRAARKGEPLPAGHHSSKRNHAMEEAGGPAGEMKRPKVEV